MTTLSSYVVDFSADDRQEEPDTGEIPAFRALTCPEALNAGDPFQVVVQGPPVFGIRWPYPYPIVAIGGDEGDVSEAVNLGGSAVITPSAPVVTLNGLNAINDLVNGRPAVVHSARSPIGGRAQFGRLLLAEPLWGTVRIEYRTHNSRWYCGGGVPYPGQYAYQVVYMAPLLVGGVPTGEFRAVTETVTFQVAGDLGTDIPNTPCAPPV